MEFFLNSLNWLLEREGQFVKEAKKPPSYSLSLGQNKKIVLKLGALFLPRQLVESLNVTP